MYNPKTTVVRIILPEGYYTEYDEITQEGILAITDLIEDAGFEVDSIEQQ